MFGWGTSKSKAVADGALAPPRSARADSAEHAELQLLQGIVRGRRDDFEALYRIYYPRLYRFLERLTHRPELSEELLDDTLLLVWQRGQDFNGRSKLSTWIFGIAYRKALKALSRQDLPPDDDGAAEAVADAEADPERRLGHSQLQRRLAQALGGLSAEQRAVVELCYFHGFDYREIAQIVDCPAETVKTRMFHARRRLRPLLADFGPALPGEPG
ncbi:RNA polymerase sigma factor [Roseateles violae]|uniref:Sigma-70 family RNA polymerase sigma factor n=1 Tax=Roseateles violae TaxID=3058042 RepID=A0ABT8DS50_9BURK|nr:sigma-70 family RNA polymerase sigma factor [Pelomonas sp. PFR6]MDN3919860.1 sigma-70 family RNA polymerase sigma factor [Pelomonas sp. PFR6]